MARIGNFPYFVHYVLDEGASVGECRPATVVGDYGDHQDLLVFTNGQGDGLTDVLQAAGVPYADSGAPHTWHNPRDCTAVAVATTARTAPADVAPLTTAEWDALGAQPTEGEGA